MYGYKITFEGLPKPVFACSTTVNNYNWNNNNRSNEIEFSVVKAREFTTIIGGKKFEFENAFVFSCLAGDDERSSYCEPDTEIEITSVAVGFKKLNIKAGELTKSDASDKSCFVISAHFFDKYENA